MPTSRELAARRAMKSAQQAWDNREPPEQDDDAELEWWEIDEEVSDEDADQ